MLVVADLSAICSAKRKPSALLAVDNTFATSLGQRPLDLGADVSFQSATKFIGGHSDLLAGLVTVRSNDLLAASRKSREFCTAQHLAHSNRSLRCVARAQWRSDSSALKPTQCSLRND
jgi:cystathionine gamma-synthase